MRVITRWRDIPDFETPEDERKFWSETSLDPRLMNSSILKTDNRESMTVTLRFDPRMLARIKRIARSRYLNYQSMIKQWLSERLEHELTDTERHDECHGQDYDPLHERFHPLGGGHCRTRRLCP